MSAKSRSILFPTTLAAASGATTFKCSGTTKEGFQYTHSASGPNTPGFPNVVRENAYTMSKQYEFRRFTWWYNKPTYTWLATNAGCHLFSLNTVNWTPNDELTLIGRLGNEIRGSDWDPLMTIGESAETFRLIAERTRQIANFAFALRRGNVREAVRYLGISVPKNGRKRRESDGYIGVEDAGKLVLEYQYGWRPVLGDIDSAARLIAERLNRNRPRKFRAKVKHRAITPLNMLIIGPTRAATWRRDVRLITSQAVDPTSVPVYGNLDPLSTAWNLLPGSFILDWILPVGKYLDALKYIRAINSAGGATRVQFTKSEWTGLRNTTFSIANSYGKMQNETGERLQSVILARSVNQVVTVPRPNVKTFANGQYNGLQSAINGTALAAANLTKLFRR